MGNKVWFITGASKGFGMELTKAALEAGDRVIDESSLARTRNIINDYSETAGAADRDLVPPGLQLRLPRCSVIERVLREPV